MGMEWDGALTFAPFPKICVGAGCLDTGLHNQAACLRA
jgi:hypothetical protein